MLMEKQAVIEERQRKAKCWQEEHKDTELRSDSDPADPLFNALLVLLLDPRHTKYLAEHDPMGLKQAQKAVSGKCWEDYK